MGADNSKSPHKKVISYAWLFPEEKSLICETVKKLGGQSQDVSAQVLQMAVSATGGEVLGKQFVDMLQRWQCKPGATSSSSTEYSYSSDHLTSLLMEVLNPDAAVQARVTLLMAGGSEDGVIPEHLIKHAGAVVSCYCRLPSQCSLPKEEGDSSGDKVAGAWLQDLLYGGDTFKQTAGRALPSSPLPAAAVHRWLCGVAPVYGAVLASVLRHLICPALPAVPTLLPEIVGVKDIPVGLTPAEVLLVNTALPCALRCQWRLLFSNRIHGDSFSSLMKQIVGVGPTLVVVEDEKLCRFGGFAAASWEVRPQFHGTSECFLFSACPSTGVYRTTGFNTNYQYLNFLHNNTMPNGLGMGGREELFGMFLSYEFGECRVSPTCSTFHSPPLCPHPEPRIRYLTVWGVGEELQVSDDEEEEGQRRRNNKCSALDCDPEGRAMLSMIGRGQASAGVRDAPDDDL